MRTPACRPLSRDSAADGTPRRPPMTSPRDDGYGRTRYSTGDHCSRLQSSGDPFDRTPGTSRAAGFGLSGSIGIVWSRLCRRHSILKSSRSYSLLSSIFALVRETKRGRWPEPVGGRQPRPSTNPQPLAGRGVTIMHLIGAEFWGERRDTSCHRRSVDDNRRSSRSS
jgi:hypothetical protein